MSTTDATQGQAPKAFGRKKRSSKGMAVVGGVAVIGFGVLGLGTGGFGAFTSFQSANQTVNSADARLALTSITVAGDPGGTAITEAVIDMIPGDYRERLVLVQAPVGQTLNTLQYAVSGVNNPADPTTVTLAGINQVGDSVNLLAATNATATAGQPGGNSSAGQGGLAIELYTCAGTWSSAVGVIATRTDDRDYTCSGGGNGVIAGTFLDVPTTGLSTPMTIAATVNNAGQTFLIRTRLVDDGTTDGRQNVMMSEGIDLTHRFTASVRTAGAV